jgi:serine/threonine-protein kinase HipA
LTDRTLDVYCFGQRAGTLTDGRGGLQLAYDPRWLEGQRPPLSHSLPLDGTFSTDAVTAFFGGLLPEGPPREMLARQLGVSVGNVFGLLEQLGGDTAGAVSVVEPGTLPPPPGGDVEWLDETGLAQLIDELPRWPMHADADGEFRLSLAGVQDKLPVVVGDDGRLGLTKGGTPSTHILKTPVERLPNTIANEAFCLDLGRRLRIDTAHAMPRRALGREYLLVERYDRIADENGVHRLHQEDFCQALAIPSERKYESEGGPSLADCYALVREATAVPASQAIKLLDYLLLSLLVGNHDGHGKNYSLLYVPDRAGTVLAPQYDVLSTIAYENHQRMSRKQAMKIGGEYRPQYLRTRHLDRLIADAGLGPAATRRRVRAFSARAPAAAANVRAAFDAAGWGAAILDRIVEIVGQRAGLLMELATPADEPA